MRRYVVALVGLLALVVGVPTASAAPVTVTGEGSGSAFFTYDVFTGARTEIGAYSTTGQLGSGSFTLATTTQSGAGCSASDHPTTTARFVRSDGAALVGTASEAAVCGAPAGQTFTVTFTHGTHELLG